MAPRVLIARMSAIGDTVLTLPLACAVRKRYPDAFIGWVVEEKSAAMVADHPQIDRVFTLPRGWFFSPSQMKKLREDLRASEFTATVDCQGNTKTALACYLSGAPQRIGLRGRYGTELSPYLNNVLISPRSPHITDRSLELLGPLGIENPTVDWQMARNEVAEAAAASILASVGVESPFCVMNPGATWDSKRWQMDRFGDVARHLGCRRGLPSLVVWGNAEERGLAKKIVEHSQGHATLAPQTSLDQLIAVLRRASMFVSSDTGPLHMAVAVGTPSVGLYGSTRLADCGPYGEPHVGIQVRYHGGSRRTRRLADNSAMLEISTERVCHECDQLIDRGSLKAA